MDMATRAHAVQEATQRRQSVLVTADPRIPGVRLQAGGLAPAPATAPATTGVTDPATTPATDTPLVDDDHRAELLQFSPDFIVFPDASPRSKPPWPNGKEDYHPRRVEAFTDIARPYIARPAGALVVAYVLCFVGLAVSLAAIALLLFVVPFSYWVSNFAVIVSGLALLVGTLGVILTRRSPSVGELLRRSSAGQPTFAYGIRGTTIDPPIDSRWAEQSWQDYQSRVAPSGRYPRTSYARAVERDGELFLQYWQFYVFNDWYNRHEADWEVVVVRVAPTANGWCPVAAAYSSHFGGHWRAWTELESRDGTHPVVFVARGSHAQYFESNPEGYLATLTQPLGVMEFRLRLTFQRDWRDELAARPVGDPEAYELVVLPATRKKGPRRGDPREDIDAFWWLAFDGLWGGREAIEGPPAHRSVWDDPWTWIANETERDSAAWAALPVPDPGKPC
jgi:hypothetical protein